MFEHSSLWSARFLDHAILVLKSRWAADVRSMDSRKPSSDLRQVTHVEMAPSWSIRKLVELVDEAIDAAGAQLARSAGLWADSPFPFDERDRPMRPRSSPSPQTQALLEEVDRDHGMGPM